MLYRRGNVISSSIGISSIANKYNKRTQSVLKDAIIKKQNTIYMDNLQQYNIIGADNMENQK